MKSYTSLALIMMLGYAMAADSDKTLRRKLSLQPPNIATPEAGAFVSLSQLKYKHSSNEDAEYGSTLEYAVGYGDSVRNSYGKGSKKGSTVGTKKAKKAKIPSISSQYGKDCPKKNKSKDGAKGSKKSAAPTITRFTKFRSWSLRECSLATCTSIPNKNTIEERLL